jgi:hypothetical protein
VPKKLHKGVLARRILREVSAKKGSFPEFILGIGDDASDEKMFAAIFSFLEEQVDQDGAAASSNVVACIPTTGDNSTSTVSPSTSLFDSSEAERTSLISMNSHKLDLPAYNTEQKQYAFTIAVGKKPSVATQFVHSSQEVEELLLNMTGQLERDETSSSPRNSIKKREEDPHAIACAFYEMSIKS